jgi:hypothetical protein
MGYMGEDMFIIYRIGQQELALDVDHAIMQAYNKVHADFKVQVEWGIGVLKRKWKHFMKRFDSTKQKYSHLFQIKILLIIFLHMKHMDPIYQTLMFV